MMLTPKPRVLLGMSGGLDSQYAARCLADAGYEVVGAVLVFSEHTDVASAQSAADEVGVPLIEIDAREAFERYVVENFVSEYARGRTPNPCVVCNRHVKMALLYQTAKENGFDYYATGHYARVVKENGRFAVAMAKDLKKDQSYMLWGLSQDMLSMLLTPLAEYEKKDVQRSAAEDALSTAAKKESQDICFIPDGDYVSFIARYAEDHQLDYVKDAFEAGDFILRDKSRVGRHRGIVQYTVGQRKHLGVALGYPAYVVAISPDDKTVTLSDAAGTYEDAITVDSLVFSALSERSEGEIRCDVKIRYAAKPVPCRAVFHENFVTVYFDTPQRTPAKGQSCVFYQDGIVLLGGIIA